MEKVNLGEMGRIGFTCPSRDLQLSTKVCDIFYNNKKKLPQKLLKNIEIELRIIEKKTKKNLVI